MKFDFGFVLENLEIFDLDGHNLDTVFNLTSYSYFYSNHPSHQPIHSVPDADAKGQHDSWPAKGRFPEFPGKDADCQDAEYYTYEFGEHSACQLIDFSIESFNRKGTTVHIKNFFQLFINQRTQVDKLAAKTLLIDIHNFGLDDGARFPMGKF